MNTNPIVIVGLARTALGAFQGELSDRGAALRKGLKRGVATLCIGGGEATAIGLDLS